MKQRRVVWLSWGRRRSSVTRVDVGVVEEEREGGREGEKSPWRAARTVDLPEPSRPRTRMCRGGEVEGEEG